MFRPLRSTVVTRFSATMGLSDSRQEPAPGYLFPLTVCAPVGLPGSSTDLSTRAAPFHPEAVRQLLLPVASLPVLGFIFLRQTGHCYMCNEAVSGSRFKHCGSRVRLARLRQRNYSRPRLLGYLSNGQLTRYPPFRNIRSARLILALRRTRRFRIYLKEGQPQGVAPTVPICFFAPFALLYEKCSSGCANFYAAIAVSFSVLAWRAANSAVIILRPFSVTM